MTSRGGRGWPQAVNRDVVALPPGATGGDVELLAVAHPGQSPGAGGGGGGKGVTAVAPPALAQDKIVVGLGAHGVEHVGLVGNLEFWREWGGRRYKHTRRSNKTWTPNIYILI